MPVGCNKVSPVGSIAATIDGIQCYIASVFPKTRLFCNIDEGLQIKMGRTRTRYCGYHIFLLAL